MNCKCERCGCNFYKKDDSDVCGVCLDEFELDEQYESYSLLCIDKGISPLCYDNWLDKLEDDDLQ